MWKLFDKPKDLASLSVAEQINIMMNEYNTLREQVLGALAAYSNFVVILLSVISVVVGVASWLKLDAIMPFLPGLLLAFGSQEARQWQSLLYIGRYISILELRINKLAGKDLLNWDHFGSTSRHMGLKLTHPSNGKSVYNPDNMWAAVAFGFAGTLFLVLLYRASVYVGIWLTLRHWGDLHTVTLLALYVIFHVGLGLRLVYIRLVHIDKLLDLYEEILRDKWIN